MASGNTSISNDEITETTTTDLISMTTSVAEIKLKEWTWILSIVVPIIGLFIVFSISLVLWKKYIFAKRKSQSQTRNLSNPDVNRRFISKEHRNQPDRVWYRRGTFGRRSTAHPFLSSTNISYKLHQLPSFSSYASTDPLELNGFNLSQRSIRRGSNSFHNDSDLSFQSFYKEPSQRERSKIISTVCDQTSNAT